jgi:hypothetical protein
MIKMVAASSVQVYPTASTWMMAITQDCTQRLQSRRLSRIQSTMIGMRGTAQLAGWWRGCSRCVWCRRGSGHCSQTTADHPTDALFDHMQKDVDTAVSEYLANRSLNSRIWLASRMNN